MSTSRSFHHGDLKAALARSAADLIERSGVQELSLRAVAREAGVSTAAPYRHYASREALLAEVARQGFDRMREALDDAGKGLENRAAFLAQCVAYVRFAQGRPALYRLMFGAFPEKHRHQELIEAGDRLFALLDRRLAWADERQRPFRAVGCWAFVHGLAMLALDDQLQTHLPGIDDASLLAIIAPLVDAYAGAGDAAS
jgi:AcrR family transcriptional regulator